MNKIIQFKQFNHEKIKKKYELEGCDDELVELAEKLAQCNPAGKADKKKETLKAKYLRKAAEYRDAFHAPRETPCYDELSDEDLDAAAGGLLHSEEMEDPFKKKD